jgi:GMP synthase (glutamine-hydrolysing)
MKKKKSVFVLKLINIILKMNKILIVRNERNEGAGLLYEVLKEQNIEADEIDLDGGDEFPSPLNYKALIVLGGPDSANDTTTKMVAEIERLKEALAANIPYLGICLGLQALVKAAGGEVVKCKRKELGFRDSNNELFRIELTEAGKNDPLFERLGNHFPVFEVHGETVVITNHMTLLGAGKECKNQIVKVAEKSYGIQCHFELTREMFVQWMDYIPELGAIDQEQCVVDYGSFYEDYTFTGKQLFRNFLKIAGLT